MLLSGDTHIAFTTYVRPSRIAGIAQKPQGGCRPHWRSLPSAQGRSGRRMRRKPSTFPRKATTQMHRAPLRRLAPAAATLLGLAAFAVPAYGAGGVAVPTIQVSAHPAGVVATADVPVAAGHPLTGTRRGPPPAAGPRGHRGGCGGA